MKAIKSKIQKTGAEKSAAEKIAKAEKSEKKPKAENPMRKIKIEKVVISSGAKGDDLVKAKKLVELVAGMKACVQKTRKRIPDFGITPGLEVGTMATVRGKKALELLARILGALNNTLKKKQISENHFSFGIKEYIEIPGLEYKRDIGIRGFNVTVDFARTGLRIKRKKIRGSKVSSRQFISKEEIIKFMEKEFKTEFI